MSDTNAAIHADGHDDHGIGHVVPVKFLVGILLALLFLTFVTVAVTWVDLGPLNLIVALGIAFLKATLVALFFMHLYWDRPFNLFILIGSLFFVALFLGFCMMDTREYRHTLDHVPAAVQERIDAAREQATTPAN